MASFWHPEPLFAGKTVLVLGGGPSLRGADLEPWRAATDAAVAVNSSAEIAPWADVLFFGDTVWYQQNQVLVATWPGLVVTPSHRAQLDNPTRVRRVHFAQRRDFPPPGHYSVRWGVSSGHKAVALALACGAARQVLLGFDCRLVGGRSHHHDRYSHRDAGTMRGSWVPGWRGWREQALAAGCEVLNATPGSTLTEFPRGDFLLSAERAIGARAEEAA